MNPVLPFLEQQRVLVLDGGLATELEARGRALDSDLWSARLLIDDPDLVRQVHLDYLVAGADCVASASYQATFAGFEKLGMSKSEATDLMLRSVQLAAEARDVFWSSASNRVRRLRPLVAASIGPYGAYLADGSEYSGHYGLDCAGLAAFHRERWHVLANSGADLIACETIPSHVEASALLELLRETPGAWAWISFSCCDRYRVSDGTPIAEVARAMADEPHLVAVGVNCTSPSFIPGLIEEARGQTAKPVIVYPNAGEGYDAEAKRWIGEAAGVDFGEQSREWHRAGATIIGGCCRTGPREVRAIRRALMGS